MLSPATYNARALSQQFVQSSHSPQHTIPQPTPQTTTPHLTPQMAPQQSYQQQLSHHQSPQLMELQGRQQFSSHSLASPRLTSSMSSQSLSLPTTNNFVNPKSRRRRSMISAQSSPRRRVTAHDDPEFVETAPGIPNTIPQGQAYLMRSKQMSPVPPSRQESIPPVPPIPDQVLIGRHRQIWRNSREFRQPQRLNSQRSGEIRIDSNAHVRSRAVAGPRAAPKEIWTRGQRRIISESLVRNSFDGSHALNRMSVNHRKLPTSPAGSTISIVDNSRVEENGNASTDEDDDSPNMSIPGAFPTAAGCVGHHHQTVGHAASHSIGHAVSSGADAVGHNSGHRVISKSQTIADINGYSEGQQHDQLKLQQPENPKRTIAPVAKDPQLVLQRIAVKLNQSSPYRPLNRPLLIHPRAEGNDSTEESAHSPQNDPSSPVTRVRSKSTFSRQWPSPKNGQSTVVAATRRMLFSPFSRKIGQRVSSKPRVTATSRTSPVKNGVPRVSAETRRSSEASISEDRRVVSSEEIRAIMRSLTFSKSDNASVEKLVNELRKSNNLIKEPITPATATKIYRLNIYEKGEILDFRKVYYCGRPDSKVTADIRRTAGNYGFDDDKGDYKAVIGDHIAYRYRVVAILGKGSFGKVLKCIDHKTGNLVAIKMIVNRKRFHMQALIEADLLKSLTTWNAKDKYHLVKYHEHFKFREHLCISTELLGINLYELIKYNDYKGLPLPLVRHFTKQILEALEFLASKTIIHCDLKPENVLLSDAENAIIKIIDFGSSCYESERVYTYIQSRFYRSPEVMLGMSYNEQIDIWSTGCIIPELITGRPLFMGENEQEQVACITQFFGLPEKTMLTQCARRKLFFDSMGNSRFVASKKGERRYPNTKSLEQVLKTNDKVLIDFLNGMLRWNPEKRLNAQEALKHEYITGSLSPSSGHSSVFSRLGRAMSSTSIAPGPRMSTSSLGMKASPLRLQRIASERA